MSGLARKTKNIPHLNKTELLWLHECSHEPCPPPSFYCGEREFVTKQNKTSSYLTNRMSAQLTPRLPLAVTIISNESKRTISVNSVLGPLQNGIKARDQMVRQYEYWPSNEVDCEMSSVVEGMSVETSP